MGSKRWTVWGSILGVVPVTFAATISVVACGGNDTGGDNTAGSGGTTSNAGSSSGGKSMNGGGTTSTGQGGTSTGQAGSSTGAGGSNSGSGFSTGLPGTKPINSLTDMELSDLCKKLADYYSTGAIGQGLQDFSCGFSAMVSAEISQPKTDADAQAACKKTYDACEMKPLNPDPSTCNKPGATCTATVAELEACQKDMVGYVAQLKSLFPACDTLTLMQLMDSSTPMQPTAPASCQTLQQKCPDVAMPPSMMMP